MSTPKVLLFEDVILLVISGISKTETNLVM